MLNPPNGSQLVNQPWNTTFSPYIHLFGQGWILIPISFIGAVIFLRTRDPVVFGVYAILTGGLFGFATLFAGFPEAAFIYYLFSGLGIAVLLYTMFFGD